MTEPAGPFVTLTQALSWVAFGDWSHSDHHWQNYSDSKQRLEQALEEFCDAACTGKIAIRAKLVPHHAADPSHFNTVVIPQERFHDFRQYDPLYCGLRVGRGLFGFGSQDAEGLTYTQQPIVRAEFYRDVRIRGDQLTKVFQPSAAQVKTTSKADKDCTRWLEEQFALDPEHRLSKEAFKSNALASIRGLSGRGFDRAWSSIAPSSGRTQSGRKKSAH